MREEILTEAERVSLTPRDVLVEAGDRITHAYFPESGVLSLLTLLEDGSTVEAVAVGNEGMFGLPIVLGGSSSPNVRVVCQIAGDSFRLTADKLEDLAEKHDSFRATLLRYANALLVEASQSAVCNRRHTAEQRAAKWLLLSHDRVEGDEFHLTQEFLASMLGVRRASVTEVANRLRDRGLIAYHRGAITILERAGLEEVSCGCYAQVRQEYDEYLADASGSPRPSRAARR